MKIGDVIAYIHTNIVSRPAIIYAWEDYQPRILIADQSGDFEEDVAINLPNWKVVSQREIL